MRLVQSRPCSARAPQFRMSHRRVSSAHTDRTPYLAIPQPWLRGCLVATSMERPRRAPAASSGEYIGAKRPHKQKCPTNHSCCSPLRFGPQTQHVGSSYLCGLLAPNTDRSPIWRLSMAQSRTALGLLLCFAGRRRGPTLHRFSQQGIQTKRMISISGMAPRL